MDLYRGFTLVSWSLVWGQVGYYRFVATLYIYMVVELTKLGD